MTPGGGRPEPTPTRQRVAAYGVCRREDGHVLLVRAAPILTVAGQWFLPGGGLEHGEEPVAGLQREFAEETGLEVDVGSLLGVLSDIFTLPDGTSLHTVRIIYCIDAYSGRLRHEVAGSSDVARWVRTDEALALPLRPYVRQALTELGRPEQQARRRRADQ
ncbi:MAG: NUDIX hydrolase [Acidimicrobiales bacterium]